MNTPNVKIIKLIPLFEIGISGILFLVSILIQNKPVTTTYKYVNNKIIAHSWHDVYDTILAVAFSLIAVTSVITIVIWIIEKIRSKEKILKHILFLILSFTLCSVVLIINGIIVSGLWTKDDYSPSCYKFTDNKHTIVIEEESFLLYGGGTIYQLDDNNNAFIIHSFSTDDGGRNNGHYDIEWHDDYAEITYKTFNTNDSKRTDKITFVN